MQEASVATQVTQGQRLSFKFTGTGQEFFKIWIVNICLSIVTLGIYSAWAKVRTNSYFYGNTAIDNSRFSYLADPVKILKGRIISVIIFAVYWGSWQIYPAAAIAFLALGCLLFPFLLVNSMSFRMRNSAIRNVRFHFNSDYQGAAMTFLLPLGAVVLFTWLGYSFIDSKGVLDGMVAQSQEDGQVLVKQDMIPTLFFLCLLPILPYLDYLYTRFVVTNTQYGEAKMSFCGGVWAFYKIHMFTWLLYMVLAVILAIGMGMLGGLLSQEGKIAASAMPMLITAAIIFYGISFFIGGYWRAHRTNMIYSNTSIEKNQLHSQLKSLQVGWLYLSNTIAIVFSVGLLIPWAKVRMARYVADCTELEVMDLESIHSIQQADRSAFGEEVGDIFDLELGL